MSEQAAFERAVEADPENGTIRGVFADWLDENDQPVRAAMFRGGVVKVFGRDFTSPGGALTLEAADVCDIPHQESGTHTRTHPDGWAITGAISEDYYVWVNGFEATHPMFGRVEGDFETAVFASSEAAFADFYEKHQPSAWDYYDI